MKVTISQMSEEERKRTVEIIGTTILMLEEGRSIAYISEQINLHPYAVLNVIEKSLRIIRGHYGTWGCIKKLLKK